MRVYIAGPIARRINGNREAFAQRAKELVAAGHEPVNPWDIPGGPHNGPCIGDQLDPGTLQETEHRYGCMLRADIEVLMYCDAITLLDGWEKSRGARTENQVAMSLGIPVIDLAMPKATPSEASVIPMPIVSTQSKMAITRKYQELVEQVASNLQQNHGILFSDQLHKLHEEAGEVAKAWIGVQGKNPRKGFSHTEQDVADELADVVITALVALLMLGYDPNEQLLRQAAKTERYMAYYEQQSEAS